MDTAYTLRSNERNTSQGTGNYVAAPLTKGSASGEGVNAPGRRQEDDVNLAVVPALVSRSSRGHAQGNSPGHNADSVVAFHVTQDPISGAQSPSMSKGNRQGCATVGVSDGVGVRRLTPIECERLQGLPDDWTQLGDTPDSRRYSGLGDAVTATVAMWIGQRLRAQELAS